MAILTGTRHGLGPFGCSEAGLLVDARDYFRAFHAAALQARSYIALAGWQFDSDVRLLRGEDAPDGTEVRLLPFLKQLCEQNPELRVHVLAWDFSALYGLEREWMQRWAQEWNHGPRMQFRFDTSHAVGGSHHQKLVLVDGALAFVGGIDLCASRWDGRTHDAQDARRNEGLLHAHGPSHDVQAYVRGETVAPLADLFRQRWTASGGGPLELRESPVALEFGQALQLPAKKVWVNRTQARTLRPPQEPQGEIRHVYTDAVSQAESLIYLETPCFTSRALYDALMKRLNAVDKKSLELVFMLSRDPEPAALGRSQDKLLQDLANAALSRGHRLGVYYPASLDAEGQDVPTQVHSKLLMVDDRFLTVGSADATNRGMGLDTELNLSFESSFRFSFAPLNRALRHVRMSLLTEHWGRALVETAKQLKPHKGLVAVLDAATQEPGSRLRKHPMESLAVPAESAPVSTVRTDRERARSEDATFEHLSRSHESLLARGQHRLYEKLQPEHEDLPRV